MLTVISKFVTTARCVAKFLKVLEVFVIIKANIISLHCNFSERQNKFFHDFSFFPDFECHYCGKGFKGANYLKVHVRDIHENYMSYPCQQCDKIFKNKNSLSNHRSLYHKTRV